MATRECVRERAQAQAPAQCVRVQPEDGRPAVRHAVRNGYACMRAPRCRPAVCQLLDWPLERSRIWAYFVFIVCIFGLRWSSRMRTHRRDRTPRACTRTSSLYRSTMQSIVDRLYAFWLSPTKRYLVGRACACAHGRMAGDCIGASVHRCARRHRRSAAPALDGAAAALRRPQ